MINSFTSVLSAALPNHILVYLSREDDCSGYVIHLFNVDTKQTITKDVDFIAGNEYNILRECMELYRNTWDTPLQRAMK